MTADGQQTIDASGPQHRLHLDDFSHADAPDVANRLAHKRQTKSSQKLPLEQGVPCDISLSLLPGGHSRLHVDLDMIAGDAMGFRVLMEDLARFYHQCPTAPDDSSIPYFDYLDRHRADTALQARRARAQAWWRERLTQLPPAPHLLRTPDRCRSDRLALQLSARETQALEEAAKAHHITLSSLFLALFAVTVGHGWNLSRFRLNVPLFHREAENVDNIIGDFSNLVLLGMHAESDGKPVNVQPPPDGPTGGTDRERRLPRRQRDARPVAPARQHATFACGVYRRFWHPRQSAVF